MKALKPEPTPAGFTLVELLVCLAIVASLAALTVGVLRPAREDHLLGVAVSQVQGWLVNARQYAGRDRVVTGLRFLPGTDGDARLVTALKFIQRPDAFGGGRASVAEPGNFVDFTGVDLYGGFGPEAPELWPVKPGDLLELQGGGAIHRIDRIVAANRLQLIQTSTRPAIVSPVPATSEYRIERVPRPMAGMPPLLLPKGIVVDLATPYPPYGPQQPPLDVLFTSAGPLAGHGAVADKVVLWLRDESRATRGTVAPQALVTVYAATGLIAAHPVDVTPDSTEPGRYRHPYRFTEDGRSSGL
jgi:prepilin-type N-terminal cleavage/methylation domain-containing protein